MKSHAHILELSLTGKFLERSVKTLTDIVGVHLASMFQNLFLNTENIATDKYQEKFVYISLLAAKKTDHPKLRVCIPASP